MSTRGRPAGSATSTTTPSDGAGLLLATTIPAASCGATSPLPSPRRSVTSRTSWAGSRPGSTPTTSTPWSGDDGDDGDVLQPEAIGGPPIRPCSGPHPGELPPTPLGSRRRQRHHRHHRHQGGGPTPNSS